MFAFRRRPTNLTRAVRGHRATTVPIGFDRIAASVAVVVSAVDDGTAPVLFFDCWRPLLFSALYRAPYTSTCIDQERAVALLRAGRARAADGIRLFRRTPPATTARQARSRDFGVPRGRGNVPSADV